MFQDPRLTPLARARSARIETLVETENFVIVYQVGHRNGKRRAQALADACERDFAELKSWFKVTKGFGPSNRVTLLVDTASYARNWGYRSDGTTKVVIDTFDNTSDQGQADDAVCSLFVAEIVEVLMDYRNQTSGVPSWNPGGSDGEGLSRFCAGLFHPLGYYNVLGGPYVNAWLSSSARKDWISTTEPSDTDMDSFGCALLFVYYLYSQLGYDMVSICTKAGATLEDTYTSLVGSSGGYAAFTQLLESYFPVGKSQPLQTDNPFPLGPATVQRVTITSTQQALVARIEAKTGEATLSPFAGCPEKTYGYTLYNSPKRMLCVAHAEGFAQPVYRWKVNDQAVGLLGNIDISATVQTDEPANPNTPTSTVQKIELGYSTYPNTSTYDGMSGELVLACTTTPGHVLLTVEVEVSEKYGPARTATQAVLLSLDTQELEYDGAYYDDQAACKAAFEKKLRELERFVNYRWIPILLTLPDPPHDSDLRVVGEIYDELRRLSVDQPEAAAVLENYIIPNPTIGAKRSRSRG